MSIEGRGRGCDGRGGRWLAPSVAEATDGEESPSLRLLVYWAASPDEEAKIFKGQHAAAALEAAASVAAGSVGIGTMCGEDGHADHLERDRDEVRDGLEEIVALARIDGCGLSPSVEDEAHDLRRLCDSLGDLYTR